MSFSEGLLTRPDAMDDAPDANVPGRWLYLLALQDYRPDFWIGLREDVFDRVDMGNEAGFEQSKLLGAKWIVKHDYPDDSWFLDALMLTLNAWRYVDRAKLLGPDHKIWPYYYANEPVMKEFAPTFENAKPAQTPWTGLPGNIYCQRLGESVFPIAADEIARFRKDMNKQHARQINAYVALLRKRLQLHTAGQKHAKWTVWYQMGLSPQQIKTKELHGKPKSRLSQAAIQQAIDAFTKSIGLTKRKPKAGRNTRTNSTKHNLFIT